MLCLFVGIGLLFRKNGQFYANLFLGLLLVLTALTMLNQLLAMSGIYAQFQYLYFIPIIFTYSTGPLLYMFVKSKTQVPFVFKRWYWLLFVLPMVQFGFYLTIGFRSAEYKSWVWRNLFAPYLRYVDTGVYILSTVIFLALSYRLVRNTPSQLWAKPVYRWLKRFILFLGIVVGVDFAYSIIDSIFWQAFSINIFNTPWASFPLELSFSLLCFWMGYNAILYSDQRLIMPPGPAPTTNSSVKGILKQLFETEKVYQNPDLDLPTLAKLSGYHKNDLSKYFSSQGSSYNDYVNQYRIEAFIERFGQSSGQHYSFEGLAFDVGFNSKSTFNRAFKKVKGTTPSVYFKEQAA